MKKLRIALVCGLMAAGAGAQSGPVVNPANNPLLGSWVWSARSFLYQLV